MVLIGTLNCRNVLALLSSCLLLASGQPAHAQAGRSEIARACAEKWGTDYEMQVYCREQQMRAWQKLQGTEAAPSASDALVATVTDGEKDFAEGILKDFIIQREGKAVCSEPHVIGKYISCNDEVRVGGKTFTSVSIDKVWTSTNGVLAGMSVIDMNGRKLCDDPMVWNHFRGPTSYINCD